MGGHYGSIHVRTEDREAVKAALQEIARGAQRKFLLGPKLKEWVSIYPNDAGGDAACLAALAEKLDSPVLHTTVYDDDLFQYAYYEAGKLLDEYSSDPDCFEQASAEQHNRLRGKPEVFRSLLNSQTKVDELRALLTMRGAGEARAFIFESERLEKFASLFGIHNALTSYEYLMEGEREGIKGWKEFLHIPDRAPEISARKAAAAALRAAKKRLGEQGVLCAECLPPDKGRQRGSWRAEIQAESASPGFSVLWSKVGGYPSRQPESQRLEPPWPANSKPVPITSPPAEVPTLISGTSFFLGRNALLEEYSIATGKLTRTVPLPPRCGSVWAIHPAGRFATTRPRQDQLGIVNLETSKWEKVLFCGAVVDWSNVGAIFENTFRQVGVSDPDLAEWKSAFVCASENILNCRFSPDGSLLFCAMTTGLQIFEWDKILIANKTMPEPLFSVNPVPAALRVEQNYDNYVYDLILDEVRNRVLFGGMEGAIRFLEVADGRHGVLFDPPGRMSISRLQLSSDRETICCVCSPPFGDSQQPWRVQVWNYRALAKLAGIGW